MHHILSICIPALLTIFTSHANCKFWEEVGCYLLVYIAYYRRGNQSVATRGKFILCNGISWSDILV